MCVSNTAYICSVSLFSHVNDKRDRLMSRWYILATSHPVSTATVTPSRPWGWSLSGNLTKTMLQISHMVFFGCYILHFLPCSLFIFAKFNQFEVSCKSFVAHSWQISLVLHRTPGFIQNLKLHAPFLSIVLVYSGKYGSVCSSTLKSELFTPGPCPQRFLHPP